MFVQTGHFIQNSTNKQVNEAITVYGTELKANNVRLAKMNLAIHGIEGKILENNSFYSNPHDLTGKCDFIMANPPFNVKKIDKNKDYVKEDPRLPFGLPKADNGNYMWIQYFNSYLNDKGRAGFVMASSATDAGNSEKLIRQQLIETKNVDVIVSVGNNFFYTRSLPCHLWFLDKGKPQANKNKILMLDARNTFRVVNSTINDFSDGQLLNMTTIVQLYRGNTEAISIAETKHKKALKEQFEIINEHCQTLAKDLKKIATEQKNDDLLIAENVDFNDGLPAVRHGDTPELANTIFETFEKPAPKVYEFIKVLEIEIAKITKQVKDKKIEKKMASASMKPFKDKLNKLNKPLKAYQTETAEFLKEAKQRIDDWNKLLEWFPESKYVDVEGLCKVVDLEEVEENDYSLTPGRYVGYSIDIDEDFDYKKRMAEIHSELAQLNIDANDLMNQIQSVKL
jgi:type I restriction enzyme M protein